MTDGESNDTDYTASRRRVLVSTAGALTGAGATAPTAVGQSTGDGPEVRIHPPGSIYVDTYFEIQSSVREGDAEIAEYEWDMDDDTTRSHWYTGHNYDQPGEYTITLTATDENGLTDTATVDVVVTDGEEPSTASVRKTYTNLDEPEVYEVEVELLNPEILDLEGVDRVVVKEPNFGTRSAEPEGFTEPDDGTFVADEYQRTAKVTFVVDGNELLTEGRDDIHIVGLHTRYTEVSIDGDDPDLSVASTGRVDGPGLVELAADRVYFGEYVDSEFETDHGPTRVYFPEATDPDATLDEIETALVGTSEAVETGVEHEQILAHAMLPELTTRPGTAGQDTFQVDEDRSVASVGSTWIHEFLHVADTMSRADSGQWLSEAYAEYYAGLLPFEIEHGGGGSSFFEGTRFEQFRDLLDRGYRYDVDLSDEDNLGGEDEPEYERGALVIGAIDREIRRVTTGATFQDVVGRLHDAGDVTHGKVLNAVERVVDDAGADATDAATARRRADDWITASEEPELWTPREHEEDFGFGVTAIESAQITGVVDGERRPLDPDGLERVDVGEPLQVEVTVLYPDSSTATVSAELHSNFPTSTPVEEAEIVESGDEVTAAFEHEFEESFWGELEVHVGTEGPFSGVAAQDLHDQEVVALDPEAALVRAVDDTTADDPATVGPDQQLALLLDQWYNSSAEVDLVNDGTVVHSVPVGDNLHLAVTDASELESGETYAIEFPADVDDTQYVEVESERPQADENPHGEIAPSTTTPSVGETVQFDIETNTDWLTAREWDMGDGTTYDGDWNVAHAFDEPGTYYVTLETQSGHDSSWTTDVVAIEVA